jgi:hypothetical protein
MDPSFDPIVWASYLFSAMGGGHSVPFCVLLSIKKRVHCDPKAHKLLTFTLFFMVNMIFGAAPDAFQVPYIQNVLLCVNIEGLT